MNDVADGLDLGLQELLLLLGEGKKVLLLLFQIRWKKPPSSAFLCEPQREEANGSTTNPSA